MRARCSRPIERVPTRTASEDSMLSTTVTSASRRLWYELRSVRTLRRRRQLADLRRRGRQLVFIAGCARSGTSLLKQLMAVFDDTAVFPRERPVWHFQSMADRPETTLVVKRTSECHRTLQFLPVDVDLVYCVRHPYDCLTSSHPQTLQLRPYHVTRDRWFAEYAALDRLRHTQPWRRVTFVRYEDLVISSNAVQDAIAGDLGLRFDGTFTDNRLGVGIRSVSVGKWLRRPELRRYLVGLDAAWQQSIARFCAEFGYLPPPSPV